MAKKEEIKHEIVFDEKHNHAMLTVDGNSYLVHLNGGLNKSAANFKQPNIGIPPQKNKAPKDYPGVYTPTAPVQRIFLAGNVAFWGDDNLFPQNSIALIYSNPDLWAALDWQVRALVAGGLIYGIETVDDEGNEKFKVIKDKTVEDFFRKVDINAYTFGAAQDFYYLRNMFPQLILNRSRRKIVDLVRIRASYCRYHKQDLETGEISQVFINANWPLGGFEYNSFVLPVVNPFYDPAEMIRNDDQYIYVYPVSYPSPDSPYYTTPNWDSVRQSGWLDVANSIPAFKKALFVNQITLKYHIEVPSYHWKIKYKDWDSLKQEAQVALMQKDLEQFSNMMSGTGNAGKTIMTHAMWDEDTRTMLPGWKITAIDDKLKDGVYIEDSQEATTKIYTAAGINPTLLGLTPGQGMGAGSGSDERVAFNNYISLCTMDVNLILKPLELIRDYNGWNPELKFRFRSPMIQTLDQVTPAARNNAMKGKTAQQQTS